MGKPRQASPDFLMALRLNSASFRANLGLWQTYSEVRKFHCARRFAEELVRLDPNHVAGYIASASTYTEIGRLNEAKESAEKAIELSPNDPEPFCRLGNVYMGMGRYELSLQQYELSLSKDENHFLALSNKALLLSSCLEERFRNGRVARDLALKVCNASHWKNPEYMSILAMAYAECGDYVEARRVINKCIDSVGDEELRGEYQSLLKIFENNKPYRISPRLVREKDRN
jgi:tetratricopeptide (TPR) repeat protein